MIQYNNLIHPHLDRLPCIIHVLNPLQHNRALPVIPEQLQLAPRVCFAGGDVALPGQRRGVHVFAHGFMIRVVRLEDAAECGVSETCAVADAFHEGHVGGVEVPGAPGLRYRGSRRGRRSCICGRGRGAIVDQLTNPSNLEICHAEERRGEGNLNARPQWVQAHQ